MFFNASTFSNFPPTAIPASLSSTRKYVPYCLSPGNHLCVIHTIYTPPKPTVPIDTLTPEPWPSALESELLISIIHQKLRTDSPHAPMYVAEFESLATDTVYEGMGERIHADVQYRASRLPASRIDSRRRAFVEDLGALLDCPTGTHVHRYTTIDCAVSHDTNLATIESMAQNQDLDIFPPTSDEGTDHLSIFYDTEDEPNEHDDATEEEQEKQHDNVYTDLARALIACQRADIVIEELSAQSHSPSPFLSSRSADASVGMSGEIERSEEASTVSFSSAQVYLEGDDTALEGRGDVPWISAFDLPTHDDVYWEQSVNVREDGTFEELEDRIMHRWIGASDLGDEDLQSEVEWEISGERYEDGSVMLAQCGQIL